MRATSNKTLLDFAAMQFVAKHFSALSSFVPLNTICNVRDYAKAVTALNALLDAGIADEKNPLANLVDTIGALIGEYDDLKYPPAQASAAETIRFLMQQHQLS